MRELDCGQAFFKSADVGRIIGERVIRKALPTKSSIKSFATRPRGMTIRDVVMLPTNFDL
jgi:hypothetical protein